MRILFILILPLLLVVSEVSAQACMQRGQTPQSAFPICGTKALKQASVPLCAGTVIPLPYCPAGVTYRDVNPFWYKFTCYGAGTLGFTITPNDLRDDYDWQLFDVTGKPVSDVYTNTATQVAGNWSAIPGATGASTAGTRLMACEGLSEPNWSSMPTLIVGHQYLLMVSHFTQTQSGYELSFGGGTANITDPLPGAFLEADFRCRNNQVSIKLNKRFQCSTMTAEGSEFEITGSNAVVTSATGVGCGSGFDMDSVVLLLDRPLPAGNYTVRVRNGTDGNTILDACDNPMAVGKEVAFTVPVAQPVPFDKIRPAGCEPSTLKVLLSGPVLCNSVAPDGSDFRIRGNGSPVNIIKANTFCTGTMTDSIELMLSAPIYIGGNFNIDLVRGSDGNTLISECGVETPLGYTVAFTAKDTVSARFTYHLALNCASDSLYLQHDGAHGVNSWKWSFDDGSTYNTRTVDKVYTDFGRKKVKLQVSNGVCTDEHTEDVLLDNELKAEFSMSASVLCPLDMVAFTNQSVGRIVSYNWDFGYGPSTRLMTPPSLRYPVGSREQTYNVRLIVESDMQCFDTIVHTIKTVPSCRVAVPTAFSPNNDGINDYLYPLNGYKTADLTFRVYGRNGQLVFESHNWMQKWDGKINGSPAPIGAYAWMLEYTDTELGTRVFQKGVTTLIR